MDEEMSIGKLVGQAQENFRGGNVVAAKDFLVFQVPRKGDRREAISTAIDRVEKSAFSSSE